MSTPIEAKSLSTLTNLFANPPQYPRNPTHQVHEPLSLYIVRVPGSKDVFLSPIKPPTKDSISLEAVQSSLYYLHVPTPEDEIVRATAEEQRRSEESNRPSVTIARKPLPPSHTSHPLPPIPHEPPYQSHREVNPHVSNDFAVNGPLRVDTGLDFGINRRHFSSSPQPPNIYEPAGDYAVSSPSSDAPPTYHNTRGFENSNTHTGKSPPHGYNTSVHRNPSPPQQDVATHIGIAPNKDPKFPPITVIRRDPTSGFQWNIGTITLLRPTFAGSPLHPVHVELTSPGYGRFAKTDFAPTRRGSVASDAASVRRAMESLAVSPSSATSHESPSHPFTRVVDFRKMAKSDLKRTAYQRTDSFDSLGRSQDLSKSNPEKNILAFDSPWQGICTFVNAIDGKTLKLKHTIQSPSSPITDSYTANIAELRFNLGWSVLGKVRAPRHKTDEPDKLPIPHLLESKRENFRRSFQQLKHKSRESFQRSKSNNSMSDNYDYNDHNDNVLRDLSNINTPQTNNLYAPHPARPSTRPTSHPRNSRSPVKAFPDVHNNNDSATSAIPTSSENEDDEYRLSLKLGRERAGGGFRGQSAKLGKLVIEDEGLKMCDLVVAAAMGVWWQHYGL